MEWSSQLLMLKRDVLYFSNTVYGWIGNRLGSIQVHLLSSHPKCRDRFPNRLSTGFNYTAMSIINGIRGISVHCSWGYVNNDRIRSEYIIDTVPIKNILHQISMIIDTSAVCTHKILHYNFIKCFYTRWNKL